MGTLVAPASRSMTVIEPDVYIAELAEYTVENWTETPDKFGKAGHYTIVLKWDVFLDPDDGTQVESMWHWVGFFTGEKANLTKITRAFGLPDIQPGDAVDFDTWIGKRLRVTVAQKPDAEGRPKSKIVPDGYMPLKKAKPVAGMAAPRPAIKAPIAPAPVDDDLDLTDNTPF